MSLLAVLCATQLGAAPPANVGVALTRREGVTKAQAQGVINATLETLREGGLGVAPLLDPGACGTKRTCLVGLARKKELEVLVVLEVANVIDDGVLRAEAVSVDEDGKRIALVEYEGNLSKLADVRATLKKLVPQVQSTLNAAKAAAAAPVVAAAPAAEPARPPAPAPVVAAPAPQPPPAPAPVVTPAPAVTAPAPASVAQAPQPSSGGSGLSAVGVALLIAGGVGVAGAGLFGVLALGEAGKVDALCPVRTKCSSLDSANVFFDNAERWQTIGLVSLIAGSALAATGLVLLLAAPKDAPKASVWLRSDGAGILVATPLNF